MNFFPDFAPNSRKEWRLLLFNQICENKLESNCCRKFWNLWELFTIIQNYSLVSLGAGGETIRVDMSDVPEVSRAEPTSTAAPPTPSVVAEETGRRLEVPFVEKDEAKRLGAKWDPERKVWYVPHGIALAPFSRWLNDARPWPTRVGVSELRRRSSTLHF